MRLGILLKPLMYLDPGSGSFIIQMVLAGFLGIAIAVKIYWKKIVAFFRKGKGGDIQDELDELDEYGGTTVGKSEEDE
jgi:hypothetical protein